MFHGPFKSHQLRWEKKKNDDTTNTMFEIYLVTNKQMKIDSFLKIERIKIYTCIKIEKFARSIKMRRLILLSIIDRTFELMSNWKVG